MYKCVIRGIENTNQYEELIKVFLSQKDYVLKSEEPNADVTHAFEQNNEDVSRFSFSGDKNLLKRQLYEELREKTGKAPKWGILTGIRPVKLAGELLDSLGDMEKVQDVLEREYLLSPVKSALVTEILQYQRRLLGRPQNNSLSTYIGIPFCPTRCLYCSFTSNQVSRDEMVRYLEALFREIAYCGKKVKELGYPMESLYMGGGTPTTLDEGQLAALLDKIQKAFDTEPLKEYTVEAGRPDTITPAKLQVLKEYGVERISINPQTMKEETLRLIGRDHTAEEIVNAFEMARDAGFGCINTDLIAGLPEETVEDFSRSLETIIQLGAENITLHTLAVKRASRLKEMDADYHYAREAVCEDMLEYAHEALRKAGYRPYYLYRQKHTSGNTENIGFCKDDKISAYNVRIMEEAQSILALGAGGISKVYFPEENRLERVANVSNYEIYIDRLEEMTARKENQFWR